MPRAATGPPRGRWHAARMVSSDNVAASNPPPTSTSTLRVHCVPRMAQFAKDTSSSTVPESKGNRPLTIRNTIYGIQNKLGFDSKQEVIVWAVQNDLLD